MTATAFIASRRLLGAEVSRLDATCYATGGVQARELLAALGHEIQPLATVADVFAVSLRQRQFVRNPSRGVRFLASTDLALVDPPRDFFLSLARTPQLHDYLIKDGWSVISATGTVGNLIYVRPELAGAAVSQDAIRVRPLDAVQPGYLFAYLSSAVARALISLRTYGTTVDRIHPNQLLDLPVPIPPPEVQSRLHKLVEGAARARTEAAQLLDDAAAHFDQLAGDMRSMHDHSRSAGAVRRRLLSGRLDAFHHVGWAAEARFAEGDRLADLGLVARPGIVKRIWAERGVPFLSGIDAFQVRPTSRDRIRRDEADAPGVRVEAGQIFVQRLGQRYGLVGRPALVTGRLDKWAATEHLFRVTPRGHRERARVFAFLRSDSGRRTFLRQSYGTSIPCLNQDALERLVVPPLPPALLTGAERALGLRERADLDEQQAIEEVEAWLA